MELWIRSQYKEMLFKVNNNLVIRHNDTVGMCFIECDNHKIAMYKTKERALEVLEEISDLMIPTGLDENEEYTSERCFTNKNMMYYQMPEE